MDKRTEKIIIIVSVAIISVLAIFFLFRIAVSPAAPDTSGNIISNIFSSPSKPGATDGQQLPLTEIRPTTLIFGGDVMLSRHVNDKIEKNKDYSWPFLKIADFLSAADLTIVNLESPFLESKNYFVPTGSFMFKANPEATAGLIESGVDLAALANNHIMNQGAKGLAKTQAVLSEAKIEAIGAGNNEEIAHKAKVFIVNNERFGFLDYAYPEDDSIATNKRPGIASMNIGKMADDIKNLKSEADVIIVMMHAGEEYTTEPNKQQVAFAHTAIENGADLVIGHHPHWPQVWETYLGKPIIYSLGNLIFDQMWSLETSQGLIAKLSWKNNSWEKIELIPIKIRDYGQAEVMEDGPEKEALLKKLNIPADGELKLFTTEKR